VIGERNRTFWPVEESGLAKLPKNESSFRLLLLKIGIEEELEAAPAKRGSDSLERT